MKYGYFDDAAREYIVETPATPMPWINYLGNEDFFSLISNTGGGYCFYRDARLRRLTRFRYNNTPSGIDGRFYYIKEADIIWSPGFLPAKEPLDTYKCRHGLGYTILESAKNGLSSSLTCFVPLGASCEINQLLIQNNSNYDRSFQLYSAVEWCFWNTIDDSQNFQRNLNIGEVEIDGSTLYHKTEYRERRNHYAFFHVNTPINGYDTDRDTFLGRFGSWSEPEMVQKGISQNSIASGWSPIACHRIDITLKPGEKIDLIFMIGYAENLPDQKWESLNVINKIPAKSLIERFSNIKDVQSAFKELTAYWDALLSHFQLESGDDKINRMINIWNQYQCIAAFHLSRSASSFESGTGRGMGFRDSCQDILGFVHLVPHLARARILDIAAIQFEDGSTYHQYQPLTKRGNRDIGSGFNDDPLWLIACTAVYIRETGDFKILEEPIPFDNTPGTEKPLFEHLRRSIRYIATHTGPHGLPLIGRADWNDCLNLNCFSEEPDATFQTCDNTDGKTAESIFLAAMFVKYGKDYAVLCQHCGYGDEADEILKLAAQMKEAVLRHGWDGEWFLRAYDSFGNKVGSQTCEEGKIFAEAQGFCAMAGIGIENGFAQKALASTRKYLVNNYGIELLYPCYTSYRKELGEITSYPPGYKENGSIFCHNNPWVGIGHACVGNAEEAFDIYRRNCPAYLEEVSDIHKTEPYVYSQTIAGRNAPRYGEAKNSWLTGTAAWSFVEITQAILGIYADYDGLIIDPCVPKSFGDYKVTRIFRGVKYSITVHNTGSEKYEIKVDGKHIEGKTIHPLEGKTEYEVEVFI